MLLSWYINAHKGNAHKIQKCKSDLCNKTGNWDKKEYEKYKSVVRVS